MPQRLKSTRQETLPLIQSASIKRLGIIKVHQMLHLATSQKKVERKAQRHKKNMTTKKISNTVAQQVVVVIVELII
jgi:hypothetical protein